MFEKIDLVLDKVRNVSSKIQTVSQYLKYFSEVANYFGGVFANIPRFPSTIKGESETKPTSQD